MSLVSQFLFCRDNCIKRLRRGSLISGFRDGQGTEVGQRLLSLLEEERARPQFVGFGRLPRRRQGLWCFESGFRVCQIRRRAPIEFLYLEVRQPPQPPSNGAPCTLTSMPPRSTAAGKRLTTGACEPGAAYRCATAYRSVLGRRPVLCMRSPSGTWFWCDAQPSRQLPANPSGHLLSHSRRAELARANGPKSGRGSHDVSRRLHLHRRLYRAVPGKRPGSNPKLLRRGPNAPPP